MNTNTAEDYGNPRKTVFVGEDRVCAQMEITDSGDLSISVDGAIDNVYVLPSDMLDALAKLGIVDDADQLRGRIEAIIKPFDAALAYSAWPLKVAAELVPKIREALEPAMSVALPTGLGAVIEGTTRGYDRPIRLVLTSIGWRCGEYDWTPGMMHSLLRNVKILSGGVV